MADNPGAAPVGSTFAAFHLLPDGEGSWLDPDVEVGAIVHGSLSPNKATAQHIAAALASDGRPVAIVEIFLRFGRRLVAVIGDEAPPLGRVQ